MAWCKPASTPSAPPPRRFLRAASIFGPTCRADGVRTLLGGDEDHSLAQWLDILSQKEVLFSRQAADTKEFVFRHALLQEAAYELLTPDDRVLGHKLAGEFLEAAGEKEAIVLVEHFERGREEKKAAYWCRFAAEQALDSNDLIKVIDRAERGVRLGAEGETLGAMRLAEAQARFWRGENQEAESAARGAMALTAGELRMRAMNELVAALGQQARFDEIQSLVESVWSGDNESPSLGARFLLLLKAAGHLISSGRYQVADKILTEANEHSMLEPRHEARRHVLRGMVETARGHSAETLRSFEIANRLFESTGDVRSITETQASIGSCLCDLGVLEDAERELRRALVAAERLGLAYVTAGVQGNLTLVLGYLGRSEEARLTGDAAIALAQKQGDVRFEGGVGTYLSIAEYLQGNYIASSDRARRAVEVLDRVPALLPAALAALSRSVLALQDAPRAVAYASRAYELLESMGYVEDSEALVRLAFVESLFATGQDQKALAALSLAQERLVVRASEIRINDWRESFLARIPEHARTLELAARHGLYLPTSK